MSMLGFVLSAALSRLLLPVLALPIRLKPASPYLSEAKPLP